MHVPTGEKSTLWQTKVSDSFPMFETFDIRPVLLGGDCSHIGQCGKFHLTLEHFGQYLVEAGLLTTDDGAIWKGNADRREFHTGSWNLREHSAAFEQPRPLSGVLCACNLPIGLVNERVS